MSGMSAALNGVAPASYVQLGQQHALSHQASSTARNLAPWSAAGQSSMDHSGASNSAYSMPAHGQPASYSLPSGGPAPPQGPAAYDYYAAQSDYLQSMIRAREARMPRLTPHIIIKGHSQPVPTLPSHGSYQLQGKCVLSFLSPSKGKAYLLITTINLSS